MTWRDPHTDPPSFGVPVECRMPDGSRRVQARVALMDQEKQLGVAWRQPNGDPAEWPLAWKPTDYS